MALFQTPPSTPAEVEACKPLTITPDQVLELDEAAWYAQVYRGDDVPQLTVRAVLMGSFLGFFLAFTNLYVGLKTGWALGVAITASILSYGLWSGLQRVGIAKTPMTILETNCMQSTASSAGYSTGGTMVSAVSALLMLSATEANPQGAHLPMHVLAAWTLVLAALGTVMAIPMKRNFINRDRLKFPSGTAAAVTLQSLYSEGAAALQKARVLAGAAVVSAIFPILLELKLKSVTDPTTGAVSREPLLAADSPLFDALPSRGVHEVDGKLEAFKPSDWTVVFDHNPLMIAAGMLVGMRVSLWMLIGGIALAWGVGPWGWEQVWTHPDTGAAIRAVTAPYKAWKEVGLWLGVAVLVSSGLVSFALQWRTILRAIGGLAGGAAEGEDPRVAATEVPMSWFGLGVLVAGTGAVVIAWLYFDVPPIYGVLAVALSFFLSLVAARATGESDITPIGAMGKIVQLTYGVLIPQSMTANLMTASITASSASSSADLLNDLKSGYLLGANPRRQFIAQLSGIFAGTIATVGGFYLLVPDATVLNGVGSQAPQFPAPSAQTWRAVAEVFRTGLGGMHPVHQQVLFFGLGLGTLLVLLEELLPKAKKWLPSPTGLGLGMILPFQYPLSMFLGALIGVVWTRASPKTADDHLVAVSSGVIAGLSIMGVLAAFFNNVIL